ncbi:hypothetical protein NQ314_002047 [Rhamnusium bicolor]|uniref:Uncharacterized protein n=1 Tax=Rhamnusium bicolor TaxID=1586634 RepID=A0AAV8ZQN0_9CUCU|nr:hypothetical protein NQ314_002047 [Rhamnusium bicolor]
MPRRKKNRENQKIGKDGQRTPENDNNKENSTTSTSNDVMRTSFDNDSLNKSKTIDPSELITPSRTPTPHIDTTKPIEDEVSLYKNYPIQVPVVMSITQTNADVKTPANLVLSEVLETPKISKVLLVQEIHSEKQYELPTLHNHWLKNDKTNNDLSKKLYNGEVNINPYLNNKEIKIVSRDGSLGEISFFSPNLFEHKSSSTPIEKLQQANIVDYLKGSLMKDNANECSFNDEKVAIQNNRNSPVMPKLDSNLNLSEKNFTYSRLNISRRSANEGGSSDSLCRPNNIGVCEKVLTRLKRYTKVSHKWSIKIVELCSQLGIQLKNSLSSICNIYTDRSMIESSQQPVCKCEEYRQEITNLNKRIEELTEEVKTVKTQIEEQKTNKQSIELLSQDLNKDRSGLHTPTSRRNSQPMVSMDMLRQVKLRPASRPSFRPETPDTEASMLMTTSPHSSLCRLLTNDGSMFRLKRLRKVGGYSFDSVHRKSLLGKERDGT